LYDPTVTRGRVLAIDWGERSVGLAISDVSRTLARPLMVLAVTGARDALERVGREVARLAAEDDGLAEVVVGRPVRLDGTPGRKTPKVDAFVEGLRGRTKLRVVTGDERLTSREAEGRLAVRERDWRRRKAKLDAAAAAVILQDYLDSRS
jgi:putative holliday junction resolvase